MDVPQILAKLFATDIKRVLFPLRYDESERKHVSVVDNITLPPIEDDFGTTVKAKNTPYVEKWVECLFPMNRHMLRSILVGDSNVGQQTLGSGSYAEVVSVHPIFGTFRPTLALKKARIADGDETAFEDLCEAAADQNDVQVWRKVEKLYSPKNNDVIAEPIITCVVSNNRVTRHFVPRFFGAACDSPMHALESGNSPNCYMWSECIKPAHQRTGLRALDTLCRKAKTDAGAIDDAVNALAELETLVAHSMAAVAAFAELGVTHNDFHVGNLIFTKCTSDCQKGRNEFAGATLPLWQNKYAPQFIDFGLANINKGMWIGGNTIEAIGLSSELLADMDFRTLVLDIVSALPHVAHFLLKCDNSDNIHDPEARKRYNVLRDALQLGLETGSEGGVAGQIKNLYTLFRGNKKLKKLAAFYEVDTKDANKNLYSNTGRYHLVRELSFRPGQTVIKRRITSADLLMFLQTYYSDAAAAQDAIDGVSGAADA